MKLERSADSEENIVQGHACARESHWKPLIPIGLKDSKCTDFDDPQKAVAVGLQVRRGKISIHKDGLFNDLASIRPPRNEMARVFQAWARLNKHV